MKYCDQCNVYIKGTKEKCPLCQRKLVGDSDEDVYPIIQGESQVYEKAVRILVLISIIVSVLSVAINYMMGRGMWWSLIVIGVLVIIWMMAAVAIRKRKNLLKNVLWQVVIITAVCIIWDKATGWYGWSTNFVLPTIYVAAMITLFVMNKVLKLQAEDYIIYGWMGALFGLLPLSFILTGNVQYRLPSVICICTGIVFLAVLIIFQGGQVISEFKRRSHW